jgi:orotate phosphoribosyltransferase
MNDRLEGVTVIAAFRNAGALLEGHFVLSSGLHSDKYLQCALVLQNPVQAERFGRAIAEHFREQKVALVASPAIGGLIIGYEVARALGADFLWTERAEGVMTLRRGFTIQPGTRTLVVEDVVTTGGSTREAIEAVRAAGAEVIAAASIIDRSSGTADVGVSRVALAKVDVRAIEPGICAACARGDKAVKPGSRGK